MDTASYREHAKAAPLSAGGMKWFFTYYLRSDAERQDPRITLSKGNLKGCLPAGPASTLAPSRTWHCVPVGGRWLT